MTEGMRRTVGAIPCRPQLGGADGSGTEVLIMHDGLFWLPVKSVTVRRMDWKWLFPCPLTCLFGLGVFRLSHLYCVHSDLEPRRALEVAFSPQILVSKGE